MREQERMPGNKNNDYDNEIKEQIKEQIKVGSEKDLPIPIAELDLYFLAIRSRIEKEGYVLDDKEKDFVDSVDNLIFLVKSTIYYKKDLENKLKDFINLNNIEGATNKLLYSLAYDDIFSKVDWEYIEDESPNFGKDPDLKKGIRLIKRKIINFFEDIQRNSNKEEGEGLDLQGASKLF